MKAFTFTLALFFCFSMQAQRPAPELFETEKGPLEIHPIFHSSMAIKFNNQVIYVDPYGGPKAYEGLPAPTLVLITDIHPDHLNPETWEVINFNKAVIIAPQAVYDKIPLNFRSNVKVLGNGAKLGTHGLHIEAVPMYNLPEEEGSKHPKGRGNGYVLNCGGKRIYISGDTEDINEMRQLKNIDIAFVCMNLPYTMDVKQASSAVLEFKPKIVYPFHYRTPEGFSDTQEFKKLVNTKDPSIEVRLREWYTKY